MTDAGNDILEFNNVAVEGGYPYDSGLWEVSFRLSRGELMLVHLEKAHASSPLADAAQGMAETIEGAVKFLGLDWRDRSPKEVLAARAKTGRVFEEPGWVSDLDIDENITLAQRHHTRREEQSILDEASELARAFSLPGLPQGRATSVGPTDLRRCACIRAFLGKPELLILERPTAGAYWEIMPALMGQISAARSRGAAVLWLTADLEVWNDPGIRPTVRAGMSGSQLRIISGD